jgi:hypothetical protein
MTELPEYADLPPAPGGGRSAWGLFGPGDNLGLVNLMTPERIAAGLVRRGQVFCAVDRVYEMFMVSAPLNAPGGIGSPANAVAIK